jgi:hypothetical protein
MIWTGFYTSRLSVLCFRAQIAFACRSAGKRGSICTVSQAGLRDNVPGSIDRRHLDCPEGAGQNTGGAADASFLINHDYAVFLTNGLHRTGMCTGGILTMPALHRHVRIPSSHYIHLGHHRHADCSDRSAYAARLTVNGKASQFAGFAANTLPAIRNDERGGNSTCSIG